MTRIVGFSFVLCAMARSRFAVFGAGRYGTQIALSLARRGAEVFTFDANCRQG